MKHCCFILQSAQNGALPVADEEEEKWRERRRLMVDVEGSGG